MAPRGGRLEAQSMTKRATRTGGQILVDDRPVTFAGPGQAMEPRTPQNLIFTTIPPTESPTLHTPTRA